MVSSITSCDCVLTVCFIAMPKQANKAKIACLDFALNKSKLKLGISVVVDDPEKLEAIRKRWACAERITSLKLFEDFTICV